MIPRDDSPEKQRKPVLIVLHQEHSTAGRVGYLLQDRGYALDIRKPRFGDALPETMADHSGAVIFGGPMSANDNEDYIGREIEWISVPLKENKPFLGICLGAQMLAKNLGAPVHRHGRELNEIGYYRLNPTDEGKTFAKEAGAPWPGHVYHWHSEGFECPSGALRLACGEDFPNQAIQVGPSAFGIQFHPEVTYAMMCRWTVHGGDKLGLPGAHDRKSQLEDRLRYDPQVSLWLNHFLDYWLASGDPVTA